jgi:hypothetical protein
MLMRSGRREPSDGWYAQPNEWRAVNRLVAVIPAAIVLIVAVGMAFGATLLGYPAWAIPLIAIFGAGGAIAAIRVLGW